MPKPLGNTGNAKIDKVGHTDSGRHGAQSKAQPTGMRGTPSDLNLK